MSNKRKIKIKVKKRRQPEWGGGPTAADMAKLAGQMLEGAESLPLNEQAALMGFMAGVAPRLIKKESSQ
jgi:hypothetical protein